MACVGIGNVSQLCSDLLIQSMNTAFLGYLDSKNIPSVVGGAPYGTSPDAPKTAGSVEVFIFLHLEPVGVFFLPVFGFAALRHQGL